MTNSIRIGNVQRAALECHSEIHEVEPLDAIPVALVGNVLSWSDADEARAWLHDLGNGIDDAVESGRSDDRASDRAMRDAVFALAKRIA